MTAPGRFCPADYRYAPASFARAPEVRAETLYVVGGLYGNRWAVDTIEQLASGERGTVDIVFNGDFHWFDATQERFAEISRRVATHHLLRGNVETELTRASDIGAGCGCAYPLDAGRLTVINNGAAGMPNFRGTNFGVVTRIGLRPSPHQPLYGVERDGVFIDALPVHYDQRRWLHDFLEDWPPGSPAYDSYFHRLVDGPAFLLSDAVGRARAGSTRVREPAP